MSTVQTESPAPSSLDMHSQGDSYSSTALTWVHRDQTGKQTNAFAINNPPTTAERRLNH